MNVSDTEIVMSVLSGAGYVTAPDAESADIILANTCAVRENAEQKVGSRPPLAPCPCSCTRSSLCVCLMSSPALHRHHQVWQRLAYFRNIKTKRGKRRRTVIGVLGARTHGMAGWRVWPLRSHHCYCC